MCVACGNHMYDGRLRVLDSSSDPQRIDFYQIKSKNYGTWTAANLVTNKLMFPDRTNTLSSVSNAEFRVKVKEERTASSKTSAWAS